MANYSIQSIELENCKVQRNSDHEPKFQYNVAITNLEKWKSPDEEIMGTKITFDVFKGIEDANPQMEFELEIAYKWIGSESADWDSLKDHIILAHLIPYAREFISNITARFGTPPLQMAPVNTFQMLEEYRSSLKIETGEPAQGSDPTPLPSSTSNPQST